MPLLVLSHHVEQVVQSGSHWALAIVTRLLLRNHAVHVRYQVWQARGVYLTLRRRLVRTNKGNESLRHSRQLGRGIIDKSLEPCVQLVKVFANLSAHSRYGGCSRSHRAISVVCCDCSTLASLSSLTNPRTSPTCFVVSSANAGAGCATLAVDMLTGAAGFGRGEGLAEPGALWRTWIPPRRGEALFDPPVYDYCQLSLHRRHSLDGFLLRTRRDCNWQRDAYQVGHDLRHFLASLLMVLVIRPRLHNH